MKTPTGFQNLFPYIFVKVASDYLTFLECAFGAKIIGKTLSAKQVLLNARVQIGQTAFMISEATDEFGATNGAFYLFVENARSSYKLAIQHGAESLFDVIDMPYGDRQGGVKDQSGNIWWISERIVDGGYD